MNRLVPYLDLFSRLDDQELGRLAGVHSEMAAALRRQVDDVQRSLGGYVDLLPRLSDAELVRLTGASPKTIRFWRLCQPRTAGAARDETESDAVVARPRDARTVPVSSAEMEQLAQTDASDDPSASEPHRTPEQERHSEQEPQVWAAPRFEGLDEGLDQFENTRVGAIDDPEFAAVARGAESRRRRQTERYADPLALSGQPFPGFEDTSFPPPGSESE